MLAFLNDFIWAAFLDDNEWWIKGYERAEAVGGVNPRRH